MTTLTNQSNVVLTGVESDILSIVFDDGTTFDINDFNTALSDIGAGLTASSLDVIIEVSTANITITGIPDGDHYLYLNDSSHNEIFRGLVTFAAEAATLPALPLLVGVRYFGYWPGTNAPTDGAGVTGVTV
jgi:hypothetical protein